MSDARTKLDILYHDVLGDIHELFTKLDLLRTELPNTIGAAKKPIEELTSRLEGVAIDIDTSMDSLRVALNYAEDNAKNRLAAEAEAAINNAQNTLYKTAQKAITDGFAVNPKFKDKIIALYEALDGAEARARKVQVANWYKFAPFMLAGALIGGSFGAWVFSEIFSARTNIDVAETTAQTIGNVKFLVSVRANLDCPTRKKVDEAVDKYYKSKGMETDKNLLTDDCYAKAATKTNY